MKKRMMESIRQALRTYDADGFMLDLYGFLLPPVLLALPRYYTLARLVPHTFGGRCRDVDASVERG